MSVTKEELDKYNKAYMNGTPLISDAEWDVLQEEYVREHGEDARFYSRREQTDSVNALVCTLSKTYGVIHTMRPDQVSYESWVIKNKISPTAMVVVQPKFDGCSIAMDCNENRFFKRGDYDNGISDEVTDLFINNQFDNKKKIVASCDGVKFECITSIENHLKDEYETPRDQTAGLMQSRDPRCSTLTLIPLRELRDGKQYVASSITTIGEDMSCLSLVTQAGLYDEIQIFINDILNHGTSVVFRGHHYKCDGVVVSVLNTDNSIAKEVAIKIIHDVKETKLVDVVYQMGLTGKVTPVAIVEPTLFAEGKRTVTRIGLSNINRVQEMNLRYNDTVQVMYNIVPYLIDSRHDGDKLVPIPEKCPSCGSKWDTSVLEVRCENPNCPSRKVGEITRYVIQMGMKGISESTINNLFDAGLIHSISDLYKLTTNSIQSLDGYGETSANNIIKTIHDASTDVPISQWLGALPFDNISRKTWDLILNGAFGNDELNKSNMMIDYINMEPYEFVYEILTGRDYKGIGDVTKTVIENRFVKLNEEMRKILPYVTFKTTTKTNANVKAYVTFTGCRPTEEDSVMLNNRGYVVIDFGAKTNILIVPNDTYENNKTKKCHAKNIPIITYTEMNERLS